MHRRPPIVLALRSTERSRVAVQSLHGRETELGRSQLPLSPILSSESCPESLSLFFDSSETFLCLGQPAGHCPSLALLYSSPISKKPERKFDLSVIPGDYTCIR